MSPTTLGLRDYSGKLIPSLGTFEAEIEYSGTQATVTFYVTQKGASLLGLDAIQKLQINIVGSSLTCLHTTTNQLELPENTPPGFEALFSEGLGFVKDYVHQIKRRPDVTPVIAKLRRLPLALRQQVSDELARLEHEDIIERVDASEWVSPLVVVKKKDGSLRLCVDLREPNKAIVVDGYPLPHTEELLQLLAGATWFSKLDLASAYHQVGLTETSRELTTFISHEGLFRFKRVCFGLASAPATFQKLMSNVLKGCANVVCYLDDILVWGRTKAEHDRNLKEVL